jgi:hypothetical protein
MKLGFVSMPVTGDLNPMTALARKLQSRGNEVVYWPSWHDGKGVWTYLWATFDGSPGRPSVTE